MTFLLKTYYKTLIIKVVSIIILSTLSNTIFSQNQTVYVGSIYNYSTTASLVNSTFNWNVTGGVNGTNFNFNSADHDNSTPVSWLQTGTYTVQVTEVSEHNCVNPSAPSQYVVQVINCATVQFTNTSSSNCTGAAGTDLTLDLSFTGMVVYPLIFNYTVDGIAHQRTINSGTQVSLGSEDDILVNNGSSDLSRTIVITSVTSHGANLIIGANNTYIYTVYPAPQLNPMSNY